MTSTAASWCFIVSPRGHAAWPVADWVQLSSAVCVFGRASSVECSITASPATTASVVAVCQFPRCTLECPYELDDNSLCSCLLWFQDARDRLAIPVAINEKSALSEGPHRMPQHNWLPRGAAKSGRLPLIRGTIAQASPFQRVRRGALTPNLTEHIGRILLTDLIRWIKKRHSI